MACLLLAMRESSWDVESYKLCIAMFTALFLVSR